MKKIKMIPIFIDDNHECIIDKFISEGGIYNNINNGILLEPLHETLLSNYFGEKVVFVGQYGYDYITQKSRIKIEHKVLTMTPGAATLKNFGEIKSEADYLSIYHPILNKLYIMKMSDAKDKFQTTYDITNNKEHVAFTASLEAKRFNSMQSYNSHTLQEISTNLY